MLDRSPTKIDFIKDFIFLDHFPDFSRSDTPRGMEATAQPAATPTTQPESSVPGGESDFPKLHSIYSIPDWIKNNAGWWADGLIDDSSFLQGIQFLIKEGIMTIPSTETSESTESQEVPAWIKNNAEWWAEGQIDDNAFVSGIQYLIKVGIIVVT